MLPQSPFIGGSYFVPWTRRNFDVMVRKEPDVSPGNQLVSSPSLNSMNLQKNHRSYAIVSPGEAAM